MVKTLLKYTKNGFYCSALTTIIWMQNVQTCPCVIYLAAKKLLFVLWRSVLKEKRDVLDKIFPENVRISLDARLSLQIQTFQ